MKGGRGGDKTLRRVLRRTDSTPPGRPIDRQRTVPRLVTPKSYVMAHTNKREERGRRQLFPTTTAVPHMHKAIHGALTSYKQLPSYSLKTKGTPAIKRGCFTVNSWPPCSTHHELVSSFSLCINVILQQGSGLASYLKNEDAWSLRACVLTFLSIWLLCVICADLP
jgi:hypothetical protein